MNLFLIIWFGSGILSMLIVGIIYWYNGEDIDLSKIIYGTLISLFGLFTTLIIILVVLFGIADNSSIVIMRGRSKK